ncbi:MAG: dockerin type I domain-containing protein [Candidatus Poribacteria bacterium]|nr:dockerin type I domain-containing protein [Candidatus Poribacteria bacterium]
MLLNGQTRFEHLAFNEPSWVDGGISLSEHAGETVLLELVTDSGETVSCDWAHWGDLFITAKGVESSGDVNQDGIVNVLDIIFVAQNLGQKPPADPRVDVNKDGQVNVLDLVFVAERLGEKVAAAPSQMDFIKSTASSPKEIIAVQRALRELVVAPARSHNVEITIQFLRVWLANANQSVRETKVLPNYPNPFNPETWIPYQLADAADVSMKIYDAGGRLVRTIPIGFKPVGYYLTRQRAAYWDGRNKAGEPVSSGVYFLQFVAGDFAATQRVVIVK